jgi:hypothetical protein
VEGFAIFTLIFRNEDKAIWTGECRELGTATDGPTLEQVHAELVDLVLLHLNTLEKTGERERFFAKHEIAFYPGDAPPTFVQLQLPVDEDAFLHAHVIPLDRAA